MSKFESLVRRALMDANLLQFETVLKNADSMNPDFSPRYRRDRLHLLADPFGWMKRKAQSIWKKALRNVACVLLACTLTLGTLMAVSPTVRAAVLNWLREISGNLITYSTVSKTEGDALPSNWRITWLPEGWRLEYMSRNLWRYEEENGAGSLMYACYTPDAAKLTTNVNDVADADSVRNIVQIQGSSADYYQSEKYRVLLWENADKYLFLLRGGTSLEEADFLKIAESIAFYAGPDTAYEMGWAPPEYEPMYRDELVGAAEETWTYNRTMLTWQYITDSICPLAAPDGEPEEVTVGGLTAWYWAGEAPETQDSGTTTITSGGESAEMEGSTVVMGDVSITVSTTTDQSGTLVWTDPETNTTFLLEGALDRYDLLRMAESVTEKEPEPSKPSGNSMVMSGTAYGG